MATAEADWQATFDVWLAPFLARLRRAEQRRWAPVYRQGLLGPGERKSVEPMAARVAPRDVQQLHHSSPPHPGPRSRWKPSSCEPPSGCLADLRLFWSSTTQPWSNKGDTRWAWRTNIAANSARRPTARPWSRSLWLAPRCQCASPSGSSCHEPGPKT